MKDCPLCERSLNCKNHTYPYLIHEFKYSYFVLGEHQYYPGYSLLVLKDHYREMTDLPTDVQLGVFEEMMKISKVIQKVYSPDKMNMCSLGNVVEHIHWHFFPRYHSDTNFKNPPWLQMKDFDSAKITPEEAKSKIVKIQSEMKLLGIG